jgi:heterodisulfide reductase subunit C
MPDENKSSVINNGVLKYEDLDHGFRELVANTPGGEKLANCYQCGTCTAGCPVSELRESYSPKRILKMALLGMKEQILTSPELWQCTQCHVCVAHCPQDVRCADIIRVLRQLAVGGGYVPQRLYDEAERIDVDLRKERIKLTEELCKQNTGVK